MRRKALLARIRDRVAGMAPDGDKARFVIIVNRLEHSKTRVLVKIAREIGA